jgi:purine-cytosine permease-like protein
MVALRPSLGIRGSYIATLLNIGQLIGWAGLEIIIMAQAAGAISDHFFGFEWYYAWLAAFAIVGTAFAVSGPVVVVRDFLERFGVWTVIAATSGSWRLFATYDVQLLDDGAWRLRTSGRASTSPCRCRCRGCRSFRTTAASRGDPRARPGRRS